MRPAIYSTDDRIERHAAAFARSLRAQQMKRRREMEPGYVRTPKRLYQGLGLDDDENAGFGYKRALVRAVLENPADPAATWNYCRALADRIRSMNGGTARALFSMATLLEDLLYCEVALCRRQRAALTAGERYEVKVADGYWPKRLPIPAQRVRAA